MVSVFYNLDPLFIVLAITPFVNNDIVFNKLNAEIWKHSEIAENEASEIRLAHNCL